MELTMLVAKILAIYLLSVGVGMFNGSINIKKMMDSFEKSQGLLLVAGFICIILGFLIVDNHNIWVKDWTVIVTIAGWGALVKGVLLITFPETLMSMGKSVYKNNSQAVSFIALALGAVLAYYSFVA